MSVSKQLKFHDQFIDQFSLFFLAFRDQIHQFSFVHLNDPRFSRLENLTVILHNSTVSQAHIRRKVARKVVNQLKSIFIWHVTLDRK